MTKKISIITAFPISIPHPRVETERKILTEAGFEVKVMSFPRKPGTWELLVNYFSLNFFKKHIYKEILESLSDEDIIILYDLQLLRLAGKIRKRNIRVIYETIDNMVHLNYHYLSVHMPLIRPAGKLVLSRYANLERRLASETEGIIVNSRALSEYFQPVKTDLIYYCSPFEELIQSPKPQAASALLYLGLFSTDKGARETLDLRDRLGLPLFILGDIKEGNLAGEIRNNPAINWEPRQSPEKLRERLSTLRSEFRLLGVSIIQPVHHSYATQEANKDQDYLAMGIPIIGNTRVPTLEKIRAGCGLLYTDHQHIMKLMEDPGQYNSMSNKCLQFYNQNYAYEIFREKLLGLINQLQAKSPEHL